MVLRHGLKLTLLGVAIGLAAAFGVTRLIASLLFVSPTDGLTFTAISVLLTAVAMLASLLPARRAARVDPLVALRQDYWRGATAANLTPRRRLRTMQPGFGGC